MAKIFYVLCALSVFQIASCYVKRDVQAPNLTELAKQAENALTELHSNFLKFVGVKDNEELVNLVQTQGKTYAENIQGLLTQLSEEAKTNAGKADEVLQGLTNQLSGTLEELKAKNPELTANAEKLKEKFEESLKTVLQSTEQYTNKLKEQGKGVSEQVENALKKIYEDTREAAEKIAADVKSSVEKPTH